MDEDLDGSEDLNTPDQASFGHYLSRKAGGSKKQFNCVVAHRQCNSQLGHEPTPEFDEKFRRLNVLRGYDVEGPADPRLLRRMQPDAFGKPFPALEYLCDSANAIEGQDGVRLRRRIVRRLEGFINMIKGLRGIEDKVLRTKALRALHATRAPIEDMPHQVRTLLENVLVTLMKKEEAGKNNI